MPRRRSQKLNRDEIREIFEENRKAGIRTDDELREAFDRIHVLAEALGLCRRCHQRETPSASHKYCYVTCRAENNWYGFEEKPLHPDPHGNLRLAFERPPSLSDLEPRFRWIPPDQRVGKVKSVERWPTVQKRFEELRKSILDQHGQGRRYQERVIGRTPDKQAIALICEAVPGHWRGNLLDRRKLDEILEEAGIRRLKTPVMVWAAGEDHDLWKYKDLYQLHKIAIWPQNEERQRRERREP